MDNICYIYGLIDPRSLALRYVGKAKDVNKRFREHLTYGLTEQTHKGHWLRELNRLGLSPDVFVLEETTDSLWKEAECFHMAYARFIGAKLTNSADGGEGGYRGVPINRDLSPKIRPPMSEETKRKMSEAAKRRFQSESERKKMSERLKGNGTGVGFKLSDETKKKMSEAKLGRKMSDEFRAKMSIIAQNMPEEVKKKIGDTQRGKKKRPFSLETRTRMSESAKKRWAQS